MHTKHTTTYTVEFSRRVRQRARQPFNGILNVMDALFGPTWRVTDVCGDLYTVEAQGVQQAQYYDADGWLLAEASVDGNALLHTLDGPAPELGVRQWMHPLACAHTQEVA